jgi:ribosomal protein S18 acetylase RimI-like enzyme
VEILKCDESFTETLVAIGKKTYFDTFGSMNTEETMRRYLEEAFNPERIRQELKNPISQFYLLCENQKTVAYFKINFAPAQTDINDPESLELERIYVIKGFKGRGIGRLMIEKTEEIARNAGCRYIWLGVWEKNKSAIAFYERNGFIRFNEHVFRMGDELQKDYLLRKDIN